MARRIIHILSVLLLSAGCAVRPEVTDLQRYQLQGDVLRVTVASSDLENMMQYDAWFNRRGMLDSVRYDLPEETFSHVYTYDRRGRLTDHEIFRPDRHYEGYWRYRYDRTGLVYFGYFGWDLQEIYRWDQKNEGGRPVETRYSNEGEPVSVKKITYDGFDKEERVYDMEGELVSRTQFRSMDAFRLRSIETDDITITIGYGEYLLPAESHNARIRPDSDVKVDRLSEQYRDVYYTYEKDARGNWIRRTEYLGPDRLEGQTITRIIQYR